jgi:hypothetical protein
MFKTTVFMSMCRDEYFFVNPDTPKIPGFCRLRYYFQSEDSVREDLGKLDFKEIPHESARKQSHEKLLPETVRSQKGQDAPQDGKKISPHQSAVDLDNI